VKLVTSQQSATAGHHDMSFAQNTQRKLRCMRARAFRLFVIRLVQQPAKIVCSETGSFARSTNQQEEFAS
jgi:hypothetical protein